MRMDFALVVVVLFCITIAGGQNTTAVTQNSSICPSPYENVYDIGGRNCCKDAYQTFRSLYNWLNGHSLAFMLEKLRAWNCTQFWDQCQHRTFQLNRFTSLMYDRFCNYSKFDIECLAEIKGTDVQCAENGSLRSTRACM